MIIATIKNALPLETVLAEAGVHLERGKARCPFHADKNPSLSIKGERWICFAGCGSGDLVDFASKFYGLNTRDALKFLADRAGITPARTQAKRIAAEKARRERARKAELVRAFRVWEQSTVNEIAEVLRAYRRLRTARTTFTEAELINLAELQGEIDALAYRYEILCGRDDEAKFQLYQEENYAGNF